MDNASQCIAMTEPWSNKNAESESGSICSKQWFRIVIEQFDSKKVSVLDSVLVSKKSPKLSQKFWSQKKFQTQNKVLVLVPMNILTLHSANMYVLWLDQYSHKNFIYH